MMAGISASSMGGLEERSFASNLFERFRQSTGSTIAVEYQIDITLTLWCPLSITFSGTSIIMPFHILHSVHPCQFNIHFTRVFPYTAHKFNQTRWRERRATGPEMERLGVAWNQLDKSRMTPTPPSPHRSPSPHRILHTHTHFSHKHTR
jgi:hypothetical protein